MADADVITPSDEQIDRLFVAASCILICLVKKTCATAGGTSQRVLRWFNQSGALTFNFFYFFFYLPANKGDVSAAFTGWKRSSEIRTL